MVERLNKCETCKYCTGENVLICRREESDNNTDFVAKEMTCECYENNNEN